MNKKITLLVLGVVLAAMALVFFTHMGGSPDKPRLSSRPGAEQSSAVSADRGGRVNPLQNRQEASGGLTPIDPPLGASSGRDGMPKPVMVTAGQDPKSVKPVDAPASDSGPGAEQTGQDAGQVAAKTQDNASKPVSRSPSLTPWELPPEKTAKPQAQAQQDKPKPQAQQDKPKPQAQQDKPKPAEKAPQEQAKQPALSDKGAHTLKNINLQYAGQTMKLRIEADNDFPCKSFILTGPDRLVIDLPGSWKGIKAPAVPPNNMVKNARVGQQAAGPRLVLDLNRPIKGHKVQRSDKAVEILLQ